MDERLRFVARRLDGEKMAVLCREFGISRKTGYKIFCRYKDCGVDGLTDRSRRPYRHARQLPFQIEKAIVQLKQEHPSWGALCETERSGTPTLRAGGWPGGRVAVSDRSGPEGPDPCIAYKTCGPSGGRYRTRGTAPPSSPLRASGRQNAAFRPSSDTPARASASPAKAQECQRCARNTL